MRCNIPISTAVLAIRAACFLVFIDANCSQVCECIPDVVGLVITTASPITTVALSGAACADGRFRCVPADFDNTIHDPCSKLQVEAKADGLCMVELIVGGNRIQLERQMPRRPPGCCGDFIGEANHAGEIDLTSDAGAGGGPNIDASEVDGG